MAEPAGNQASSGDANTPSRFDPFGPNAYADEARQSEFTQSSDSPTDVNNNAVVAREQAGTFTLMGKNFEANAMRFNGLMNHKAAFAKEPA